MQKSAPPAGGPGKTGRARAGAANLTRKVGAEGTGLQPGSIPPFGSLFGLPTRCDPALAETPSINFNAGDHALSVQMAYSDFLAAEKPALVPIT